MSEITYEKRKVEQAQEVLGHTRTTIDRHVVDLNRMSKLNI